LKTTLQLRFGRLFAGGEKSFEKNDAADDRRTVSFFGCDKHFA